MILSYLGTSVELRDPKIGDGWTIVSDNRLLANRSLTEVLATAGRDDHLLLSISLLLDRCQDDDILTFLSASNGEYATMVLFDQLYSIFILSTAIPIPNQLNWQEVDLSIRIISVGINVLGTEDEDYVATEAGFLIAV